MRCPLCNLPDIDRRAEACPRCGAQLPWPAAADAARPGASFASGRYKVVRLLGRSSVGFVYLVKCEPFGREAVVEEFLPQGFALRRDGVSGEAVAPASRRDSFGRALKSFAKQALALSHVTHPNLAGVYDIFEENGTAYLVREHLPHSRTLRDELDSRPSRKLTPESAREIVSQLVGALEAAHAAGVFHLDISPDNILLEAPPSPERRPRAVLVNFGAFRVALDSTEPETFFAREYAAPEVWKAADVGPESDVFSLGMVLHEMLTGERPMSVWRHLFFDDGWEVSALDAPWQKLLESALRLEREVRPRSVREWWQAAQTEEESSATRRVTAQETAAASSASTADTFFPGPPIPRPRASALFPFALAVSAAGILFASAGYLWFFGGPVGGGGGSSSNTNANSLPATPGREVTVERYPTMECPDEVGVGQEFAVQVSLTEELVTPDVTVSGRPGGGKVPLTLPDRSGWEIDVVLSGYGFDIAGTEGRNISTLTLPRGGDSTVALFKVTPKLAPPAGAAPKLYATLSHEGKPLTRIAREVSVKASPTDAQPRRESVAVPLTQEKIVSVEPDLTVDMMQSSINPAHWDVRIFSTRLRKRVRYDAVTLPPDFPAKLRSEYRKFAGLSARDVTRRGRGRDGPAQNAQDQMRGFGRWLYRNHAPEHFKNALEELSGQPGESFDTIQVYTNNPVLPWELMCRDRPDGGCDFLGTEFAIGRWPLTDKDEPTHADPPQRLAVRSLVVFAPSYAGDEALPAQAEELRALETFPGYEMRPGRLSAVRALFANMPQGIVHFAGHGAVKFGAENVPEYAINLEDGALDLMALRGMVGARGENHPLFFFNACSVGQAEQVANTVDGWAPAVLEAGAGGYVGALWPLNDRSAARFGIDFYQTLARRLEQQPASVALTLRDVRRKFSENSDPTFLAYVYYGDPNLLISR